ncbi:MULTISPECIES: hypothetical protein [Bacillus]|uniref:hypothetical protein n=1 Tax=Bacillus TaxID=1386 RepID=UPI0014796569|nr:hypothetical protein [Bacillus thuringiensis]MCU5539048.1 hypothetical protein [Bacillus cereus]NNG93859.1 hypothetical protein [Bacillus thuringiensis]HDR6956459.1 hypothetical protein [Bacillus cereus]HDR7692517.1 hypothetical protein [Bacillus thuringiensis]
MASVDEVIYRTESEEFTINVDSMTTQEYESKYRGFLFCAYEGCNAKMSFVYDSLQNRGYFRNWRLEKHSSQCDYHTKEEKGKAGRYKEGEVFGILTRKQKSDSLDRAFELLSMTEEEKRKKREARRSDSKKEKVTNGSPKPDTKIVFDLSDARTSPKIDDTVKPRLGSSKMADRVKDTDIGKTKTVYGFLKSLSYVEKQATITIEHENVLVDFKFEEVFTANSPDAIGYFHHIQRYLNEYTKVPFAALGEIRKNRHTDRFEVFVYDSDSIKINRMTLTSLAAFYATDGLS